MVRLPFLCLHQIREMGGGWGVGGGGWGGGGGIPVYPKESPKYPKMPKIHLNIPNINGSIVYCIPEIQRK